MLVVTYSCEHNHPWPPPSRNHHSHHHHSSSSKPNNVKSHENSPTHPENPEPEPEPEPEPVEEKFGDAQNEESLISTPRTTDEFSWFGTEMETTSSTILAAPFFAETVAADTDVAMFFPMREEDESLFADLGELPECSIVFRHLRSGVGPQVQIC